MGRYIGTINYGSTYNVTAQGPIDSRIVVEHESDLTSSTTWTIENGRVYKGMVVSVIDTGDIWVLRELDYADINNWTKIGHLDAGHGLIVSGNSIEIDVDAIKRDIISDAEVSNSTTYSSEKIMQLIGDASFKVVVVNELPETGDTHTIYFVPKESGQTSNIYYEYIYTEDGWEKIGDTEIDLSQYAKIEDVNEAISALTEDFNNVIDEVVNDYEDKFIDTFSALTILNNSLSSLTETVDNIDTSKQNKLIAGEGIVISGIDETYDLIEANTSAYTIEDIAITQGSPIAAYGLNLWPDNKIPAGTSVQEILVKLLSRELYPATANKPSITVTPTSGFGLQEIGTVVTVNTPTVNTNKGNYRSNGYTTPVQPSGYTLTWGADNISQSVTGFTGEGTSKTIVLGENKIAYSVTKTYSEPENGDNLDNIYPLTNMSHPTRSTSKVTTATTEYSAIWTSGTAIASASVTATGVYPCFANISGASTSWEKVNIGNNVEKYVSYMNSGSSLISYSDFKSESDSHGTKCYLTSDNTFVVNVIFGDAGEPTLDPRFTFAYPSGRDAMLYVEISNGVWGEVLTSETDTNIFKYKGKAYNAIRTGGRQGAAKYKVVLSENLDVD